MSLLLLFNQSGGSPPSPGAVVVTIAYILRGDSTNNWSGSPFSLIYPQGAVINYQHVFTAQFAVIEITGNGNNGPYYVNDGSSVPIELTELLPLTNTTTMVVISPQLSGRL